MSLLLRLHARPDGQHELRAIARGCRTTFPLRSGLSRAVAQDVFADPRTLHILERWARAPDDQVQMAAVVVSLQMLVEQLSCERYDVEPQHLELTVDGQ
ncbi:hypothetical protein ACG04R_16265 [Roseateles sp. BYS78W]|uniref:ABM domain-containing protein n=1 Tax=Pelomonas candidula TaxID=3299025 RepID=A0ABW7HFG4_9BURK